MRISKVTVGNCSFYTSHANYLSTIISDTDFIKIGGVSFPKSYSVYFYQNPEKLLKIVSESNKSILPSKIAINNLLHTDTVWDIPWIHSRIGSIKKVLVTEVGFGEIIESINQTYANPSIDVVVEDDVFSKAVSDEYVNVNKIYLLESVATKINTYDAIFIGKHISSTLDFTDFKKYFYDTLSSLGESIMIISEDNFKATYEAFEEFRNIFKEYGYASSIKNIGSYEKDLILHFRKESPDYSEITTKSSVFPNLYVHNVISRITKDPHLHMYIKKLSKIRREAFMYKLIYDLRVNDFMYLPKVEDHIEFISEYIENQSKFMV